MLARLRGCHGGAAFRVDQQRVAVRGGQSELTPTRPQPFSVRALRGVAEREFGQAVDGDAGRQQPTADPVRPGHHGLAQERRAQVVQLPRRLSLERRDEPGPRRHTVVDRPRREVVQQLHVDLGHAGHRDNRVVGVGHHQEREVRCAEVGGQPQPDDRTAVLGQRAALHEAEVGEWFVQLRVAYGAQRRPGGRPYRRRGAGGGTGGDGSGAHELGTPTGSTTGASSLSCSSRGTSRS